jgi:adenosine deaminase
VSVSEKNSAGLVDLALNAVDNDWTADERGPLDNGVHMALLSRRLPRAELHIHLAGAFRASLIGKASALRGPDAALDYVDVETFFVRHKEIARSLTTPDAVRRATEHVLSGAVDVGCRHVEVSINRAEFTHDAIEFDDILDNIGEGFRRMRDQVGLTGGVIVAADRDSDVSVGMQTVDMAAAARDRGAPVLGIGNDGSPSRALIEFAPVYERARALGLRTTAHANKPQDVVEVLDLGLDRIDHAWELQGQHELQQRVAASQIPVTMAMTSCYLMLPARFPTPASFPFDELRRAGVNVTLNVDDAAMFFTDSAQEYRLAAETYGYDGMTLAEIALASLEAAWIDENRESRLAAWRDEAMALVADPRHPLIGATAT